MKDGTATYRFGNFTLQPRDRRLCSDGREVYLRPKTYETLLYLLERHGHLVTKDELLDTVWAGVTVTENALTRCIKEVRSALGDEVQQPAFLRTIPRLGYEFIAHVEVSQALAEEEVIEEEFRAVRLVTTEEDNEGGSSQFTKLESAGVLAAPEMLAPEAATKTKWTSVARFGLWLTLAMLVGAGVATFLHSRRHHPLTEQDTVVLGDFDNTTGEPVFDDALKQGLAVELEQSPFLSVVSPPPR